MVASVSSTLRRRFVATAIDQDLPEACCDMALGAILPETAAMYIVALVTIAALRANLGWIFGAVVAGGTDQPAMPPGQGEICRTVMVEIPCFPVVCAVTILALGWVAQRPAMMLVLVARGASHPFSCIILACVTLGAFQRSMFT